MMSLAPCTVSSCSNTSPWLRMGECCRQLSGGAPAGTVHRVRMLRMHAGLPGAAVPHRQAVAAA